MPHAGRQADGIKDASASTATIASAWSRRSPRRSGRWCSKAAQPVRHLHRFPAHVLPKAHPRGGNDQLAAAGSFAEAEARHRAPSDRRGAPNNGLVARPAESRRGSQFLPRRRRAGHSTKRTPSARQRSSRKRAGLVSVVANFYDNTQNGELNGHKYTGAENYATLTSRGEANRGEAGEIVGQDPGGDAAAARAGFQLRRGGRGRLPVRLRRPHRHRTRSFGRQSFASTFAACR